MSASWSGGAVHLRWPGSGRVVIQRSTTPWSTQWEQGPTARLPIKETVLQGHDHFDDDSVASGVAYTYVLKPDGSSRSILKVSIPAQALAVSLHPQIRINKANFGLEVWDGARMLKRYPVAMGATPWVRKLQFDNSSTPEGRYKIVAAQPEATFYKALDIDYPNTVDKARYQLLKPNTDIGSEIEIHGQGIDSNWTFGCVALRNSDMDEIFAHPEIAVGTPVWIYGGELTLADLQSDLPADPLELGTRQQTLGLKVTCLWDRATRAKLGKP